jgi:hypothetical protein
MRSGEYAARSLSQFGAAAAIVAYVVYDPLGAQLDVEERILDRDTYRLSMRAKSFRTGGDGESGLILRRRALQLQRERGFSSYRHPRLFGGRSNRARPSPIATPKA